jgi:hypothetical protein
VRCGKWRTLRAQIVLISIHLNGPFQGHKIIQKETKLQCCFNVQYSCNSIKHINWMNKKSMFFKKFRKSFITF